MGNKNTSSNSTTDTGNIHKQITKNLMLIIGQMEREELIELRWLLNKYKNEYTESQQEAEKCITIEMKIEDIIEKKEN